MNEFIASGTARRVAFDIRFNQRGVTATRRVGRHRRTLIQNACGSYHTSMYHSFCSTPHSSLAKKHVETFAEGFILLLRAGLLQGGSTWIHLNFPSAHVH